MMESLPIRKATIVDILAMRDDALAKLQDAYQAMTVAARATAEAQNALSDLGRGADDMNYKHRSELTSYVATTLPPAEEYFEKGRRLVDLLGWAKVVSESKLYSLMDATAKDQLRMQMEYVPPKSKWDDIQKITVEQLPPLTYENIEATIHSFAANSAEIMARGVATSFSRLDRRFKSHDGFRFKDRVILQRVTNEHGYGLNYYFPKDMLIDIERVFTVLDGRVEGTFANCLNLLEAKANEAKGEAFECETEFFKIRCYKNQNAHLWFKRKDLVESVNKILARYYGEVIGNEDAVEDPFTPKTEMARNFGFFPTPPDVAGNVLDGHLYYIRNAKRILEPSAGTGNLAVAVRFMAPEARIDCIEVQPHLVDTLRAKGFNAKCQDFLAMQPTPIYDLIVMNPPFDRERDIDHVMHAYKFLAPGGRLISIMSAGVEYRTTKKSTAFRVFYEKRSCNQHNKYKQLPERSFSSVGTNVNTISICMESKA